MKSFGAQNNDVVVNWAKTEVLRIGDKYLKSKCHFLDSAGVRSP